METRYLQSFLAISEELHFGRAAAKLHLTQPSLSQHLQRLERMVGVELVARNSHEVRLTPAGRIFEREARDILQRMRRAQHSAREAAAGRTGSLRVGYNLIAGQHVLPPVLERLGDEHPGIMVELIERRTGPQLAALGDGSIDIALAYGRPTDPALEHRSFLRLPVVAVVGPMHPWARAGAVRFAELARQECILFARDLCPSMHDAIYAAAERSGTPLNVVGLADDPSAAAILVAARRVVAFASAPRVLGTGAMNGGSRLAAVRLVDPSPMIELCAVWRRDAVNPALGTFLACLEAADRSPGGPPALSVAGAPRDRA